MRRQEEEARNQEEEARSQAEEEAQRQEEAEQQQEYEEVEPKAVDKPQETTQEEVDLDTTVRVFHWTLVNHFEYS